MPDRALLETTAGRVVAGLAALLVIGVLAGLALLWPDGSEPRPTQGPAAGAIESAHVVSIAPGDCERFAGPGCRLAELELRSGPESGSRTSLALPRDRFAPPIEAGDDIRVARNTRGEAGEEVPLDDPSAQAVAFVDFERTGSLLLLFLAFVALVVVLGRWHGVRALIGLGLSLALVVEFLAPAILDDRPLVLTALIGALAVMVVTIVLSHGAGLKSMAAMLGTAGALLLTAVLALVAVRGADVTGLSSEQSALLVAGVGGQLSLQGLVVAGMVIGALGVLDDVTVSQASTVLALRRANPGARIPRAARRGARGRPRPPRRDRKHARARLRGGCAAGAADLQHRGHAVRRRGRERAGGRADRRDAGRLDRVDRGGAADDGDRGAAREPAARRIRPVTDPAGAVRAHAPARELAVGQPEQVVVGRPAGDLHAAVGRVAPVAPPSLARTHRRMHRAHAARA
jgi:hypothetical protein